MTRATIMPGLDLGEIQEWVEAHFWVTFVVGVLLVLVLKRIVQFGLKLLIPLVIKNPDRNGSKFLESGWYFIYYMTAVVSEILVLKDTDWFWEPTHYWTPTMSPTCDMEFPFPLRCLYLLQLCFYTASSLDLAMSYRSKHKDFYVMQTHHLITILLVGISYNTCQWRIGSMVLIVHDISDIFLEGAKVNLYMGNDGIKTLLFGIFASVFFVARLVIYPWRIIYPIIMITGTEFAEVKAIYTPFWLTLLGGLQMMHIYWFYLIGRMLYHALATGDAGKDIRSDDDE